jgi:hypothetical protein
MKKQNIFIEGTAQEIMAQLAQLPPGERVRLMITTPSLAIIARRVPPTSATTGMAEKIHSDLLKPPKE